MKYNIYFVEDDENVNQLIEATLISGGFNAFGFLDPELFLESIKDSRPDLIVLDLMLPKISGFNVSRLILMPSMPISSNWERQSFKRTPLVVIVTCSTPGIVFRLRKKERHPFRTSGSPPVTLNLVIPRLTA